ncbi:MAG TPA: GNAT family N-acetyltransferase [Longimicrobiales bacterium]|nr:GNAT family N-acetyltransferase [Longimicrobiales bacterium]
MSEAGATIDVRHDPDRRRFEARVDGAVAFTAYRRQGEDTVVFTHTEVPSAAEGKGVGSRLARTALEWARAQGLRVVAECPFVASYIRRHPEYAELVDG